MDWLHSACQAPEDAASPHGPDPAYLGGLHVLCPHVQQWGCGGLCWGHLGWPALLQLALAMPWYLPFRRPGLQTGSGFLQESKSSQVQTKQHNPAQLSTVKFYYWVPKSQDFTLGLIFQIHPKQDDVRRAGCTYPTSPHPKSGLPLQHCFWELLTSSCKQDTSNLSYISVAE